MQRFQEGDFSGGSYRVLKRTDYRIEISISRSVEPSTLPSEDMSMEPMPIPVRTTPRRSARDAGNVHISWHAASSRLRISALRAAPVLFFALGLCALLLLTQRIGIVDDAYISYRYVHNLIDHQQLVFTLGERVEGATDLLWLLLLAVAARVTRAPIENLALILSLVLFGASVARTTALAWRISGRFGTACLIGGAIFLESDVFLTATNGLEAALYMALLAEAFAALLQDRDRRLGILLGLLFMTRPEGFFVGLIFFLTCLAGPRSWLRSLGILLPWLGIVGAVTLFRLAYYASPVPNSVIAKSFPLELLPSVLVERSWPYLRSFVLQDVVLAGIALAMAAACGAAVWRRWRPDPGSYADPMPADAVQRRLLPCTTALLLFSCLVAARNGGDWMEHFRLLTQYAPVYGLGLAALIEALPRRSSAFGTALLGLAALGSLATLPLGNCCSLRIDLVPPGDFFALVANRLAGILRPDDRVSAEAAGLLPYRLIETPIHDPTGLMDPYIARYGKPAIPYGKIDIDYTLGTVRPSFMVWHWAGHLAAASPPLVAQYVGFCWRFCDAGDRAMVVLVRRDRLDAATAQAFSDFTPWRTSP